MGDNRRAQQLIEINEQYRQNPIVYGGEKI
jgi:hypothetical protein